MVYHFETIKTLRRIRCSLRTFDHPPINLIGPALVRDLVDLLDGLEHDEDISVVVFASADTEFFLPHVDINHVADYTQGDCANRWLCERFPRWTAASPERNAPDHHC